MIDIKGVADAITNAQRAALLEGIKMGIRRFAWWKDGVQYVGTCGTTLEKALQDVDKEFGVQS